MTHTPRVLGYGRAEGVARNGAGDHAGAEREPLEKSIDHMLEECRVVLPGVQALFGFQLVAVFSQPFLDRLGTREHLLHLLALSIDLYVIAMMVLGSGGQSVLVAAALFAICATLWFGIPRARRLAAWRLSPLRR